MHRVTTDESPLRLEVLRQVALRDLSPTRRWHLRIPEEEHSLHWFRQRGRTLQLQSWTREHDQWLASHGRSRADIRRQIEQRTQRARAALERLKEADRNASGRCQRCDLVRAQAWGLGHANWASRRCGRCASVRQDASLACTSLVHSCTASQSAGEESAGSCGAGRPARACGISRCDGTAGPDAETRHLKVLACSRLRH